MGPLEQEARGISPPISSVCPSNIGCGDPDGDYCLITQELNAEAQQARAAFSVSEAEALEHVAKKKQVHLRDLTKLGDVFWACVLPWNMCPEPHRTPDTLPSISYVGPYGPRSTI